jgi:guanylate kinase
LCANGVLQLPQQTFCAIMTQQLLGNLPHGFVFILSAPAGTGKTTLVRMLTSEFECVVESVSCTTRPMRYGEVQGKDYYFIDKETFEEKIQKGDFLEYVEVFGYYYGTSREYVLAQQKMGKHVVLVIDTQGAMKLKAEGFSAIFIFISPPSLNELRGRLERRKTESQKNIEERLAWAKQEISLTKYYDYHFVNDNLTNAYTLLRSIVIAEEHRVFSHSLGERK